jgi:HlyD family secretion protein
VPPRKNDAFSIRSDLRLGTGVIVGVVLPIIALSLSFRVDEAVRAQGEFVAAGRNQVVEHHSGGTVEMIHVSMGDRVKAGDPLLSLLPLREAADEEASRSELASLYARRLALLPLLEGTPAGMAPPPPDGLASEIEKARSSQSQDLAARVQLMNDRKLNISQQKLQLEQQRISAKATSDSLEFSVSSLEKELQALSTLIDRGFVTLSRVEGVRRQLRQASGQLLAQKALEQQLSVAIRQTQTQEMELGSTFQQEIRSDLRTVDDRIGILLPSFSVKMNAVERQALAAPIDGVIAKSAIRRSGEVVNAGEVIMEITPDSDVLVFAANLDARHIRDVKVGSSVQIYIPSSSEGFQTLQGVLIRVAPDAIVVEGQDSAVYELEAQVLTPTPGSRARHPEIVSGMPAEMLIMKRSRSAFEYLTDPLRYALWGALRER